MSYTTCCRNQGRELYVLALDIRQAFDSVNQEAVVKALQFMQVPNFLCNRIVQLGLAEQTSIRWAGKRTPKVKKGKGVKQGCPLSPRMFTFVIHERICRLKQKFPKLGIDHRGKLELPLLLAYADDLLVITESLQELDELVGELKVLLEEAGLVIHPGKSELLVRDPYSTRVAVEDTFDIGGMSVKSKPYFRYLGAYLSATLNRPISVKQRCLQGIRVAKMLLPFIQKNKPPWVIARRIYTTVVVPSIIFGLNASALTAQNRRSLRRFERKIIKEWREACGEPPGITRKLLGLRTIVQRVKSGHFMYWGHICRRNENHLLQAALNLRLTGPKRKCRPCDTWWDSLDKELASLGKTRRDFEHLLGNKQDLKKEVDRACLVPEQSDSEVSSASESNQSVSEESGHLNQSVRADSSEVEQSDNEEGILERGETGESDQSETDDSGEVNHSDESDSEGL